MWRLEFALVTQYLFVRFVFYSPGCSRGKSKSWDVMTRISASHLISDLTKWNGLILRESWRSPSRGERRGKSLHRLVNCSPTWPRCGLLCSFPVPTKFEGWRRSRNACNMRRWSPNIFFGVSRSLRMVSTAAANRRLEGKVAIVTASTEGWVTMKLYAYYCVDKYSKTICIWKTKTWNEEFPHMKLQCVATSNL